MVSNRPGAECYQVACGDYPGEGDLTVYIIGERKIMSSLTSLRTDIRLIQEYEHLTHRTYKIKVEIRTLNQIITDSKIRKKIDFISIDTEGTEYDVIQGLTVDYWQPRMLIVENNYNDSGVERYLGSKKYKKVERYKINDFYLRMAA